MRTICRDYQARAPQLAINSHTGDAAIFPEQTANASVGIGSDSAGFRGGLEEQPVGIFSAHASPINRVAIHTRKGSFHTSLIETVAHAEEGRAASNFGETQSFENSHASGHEALTAGLFPRKNVALKELDRKSGATEKNRERRARHASAANQNV